MEGDGRILYRGFDMGFVFAGGGCGQDAGIYRALRLVYFGPGADRQSMARHSVRHNHCEQQSDEHGRFLWTLRASRQKFARETESKGP